MRSKALRDGLLVTLGIAVALAAIPASLSAAAPPLASAEKLPLAPPAAPALVANPAARCYPTRLPSRTIDRARLARWESHECGRFELNALTAVESDFRSAFQPKERPSKVVVDFQCTSISASITELQLENARKVSGRFGFDRLQRIGNDFRARRLYLPGPCVAASPMVPTGVDCRVQVADKLIDARSMDAVLGYVHAAAIGELREVPLAGAVTAANAEQPLEEYSALALSDGTGRVERSSLQEYLGVGRENRIPAQLAMAKLLPLLGVQQYTDAPLTEADRLNYSVRMVVALLRRPPIWLSERYLSMAISAGHIDMVPDLVQWVSSLPMTPEYDRAKWLAVAAVRQTTGYDVTREPDGSERGSAEIIERYRRDCMMFDARNE
jgi:hypothetical protein